MQNVACPITIVQSDRLMCPKRKNEFSAMPVTIPGSAIGRISRNVTDSRPKKRNRAIANAAIEPSTIAVDVASTAARTDSQIALRTSGEFQAIPNHFVEKLVIGQLCTFDALKA